MSNSSPLLSVIVPTRERADTLPFTLRTILDQKSHDFEVVVSDNLSQDDTSQVVAQIRDDRIKYVNTGQRLSMSDNWDFALQHATGRYILIIGDDDAIMPGAVDRIAPLLAAAESKIYTWPLPIYRWPMNGRGAEVIRLSQSQEPAVIDIRKRARFSIRVGSWRHHVLPYIYHSAFHHSIPDEVRRRTGRVFHSLQPDIFSGFAAAAVTDRAVSIDYPVSVAGHSKKSNGGAMTADNAETATATLDRHMREFGTYQLHRTLYPDVPMMVNAVPDTLLVAKDLFPETYADVPFGYSEMWAYLQRMRELFRWQIGGPLEIVRLRKQIRQYHPFYVSRFLASSAFQHSINATRSVWQRAEPKPFGETVPANIVDFVKALASLRAAGAVP